MSNDVHANKHDDNSSERDDRAQKSKSHSTKAKISQIAKTAAAMGASAAVGVASGSGGVVLPAQPITPGPDTPHPAYVQVTCGNDITNTGGHKVQVHIDQRNDNVFSININDYLQIGPKIQIIAVPGQSAQQDDSQNGTTDANGLYESIQEAIDKLDEPLADLDKLLDVVEKVLTLHGLVAEYSHVDRRKRDEDSDNQ